MVGVTVAAVAPPLALAFGVSSGATAKGLVTATIGGVLISLFSGASFQRSGLTGAMAAILLTGRQVRDAGILIGCFFAGIILVIAGILELGRIIYFIPSSVITGFTSEIAIIIPLGQLDNFFGVTREGGLAILKVLSYFTKDFHSNFYVVGIGAAVILIMVIWLKNGTISCPLLGVPVLSIAALAMMESLHCGTSAGKMKKKRSLRTGNWRLKASAILSLLCLAECRPLTYPVSRPCWSWPAI